MHPGCCYKQRRRESRSFVTAEDWRRSNRLIWSNEFCSDVSPTGILMQNRCEQNKTRKCDIYASRKAAQLKLKLPTDSAAVSEVPCEEMFRSGVSVCIDDIQSKCHFLHDLGVCLSIGIVYGCHHATAALTHRYSTWLEYNNNNGDICLYKYSPFRTYLENIWILLHIWKQLYTLQIT